MKLWEQCLDQGLIVGKGGLFGNVCFCIKKSLLKYVKTEILHQEFNLKLN